MSDITIREFFSRKYETLRLVDGSDGTVTDMLNTITRLEKYVHAASIGETLELRRDPPSVALKEIDDDMLAGFLRWTVRTLGRQPETANKHLRNLKAILTFARKKGCCKYVCELDPLKEKKLEPDCWSLEEFAEILRCARQVTGAVGDVAAAVWWEALLWTVYNTGGRISAIMSIRSESLDLEKGQLALAAATQKQRADQSYDLRAETVAALAALQPHRLERVFDDWPYDRTVKQWPALNRGYRKILTAAKLPISRRDLWHKMRRMFATYIAKEAGPAVAQAMLGHSAMSVTLRYLDQSKLDRPSAAKLLPPPTGEARIRLYKPDAG